MGRISRKISTDTPRLFYSDFAMTETSGESYIS